MLIKEKAGNIHTINVDEYHIDLLTIEWYESNKRILHKKTQAGNPVSLKFLGENPDLREGDIIYKDGLNIIVIQIKPCKTIVLKPSTLLEASFMCYEIGNKHLPLFYEDEQLLVPYEETLYRLLLASGYSLAVEEKKLTNAVKTTVSPHAHQSNGTTLFSKILQLTTSS